MGIHAAGYERRRHRRIESNLMTEEGKWGANAFFLNNGQIVEMSVSRDENNSSFYLRVCYLYEYGTLPSLAQIL